MHRLPHDGDMPREEQYRDERDRAKPGQDFHEPYLRAVLGFIGIKDVDVVRVEGMAMSAIGPQKALAFANARIAEILARAA